MDSFASDRPDVNSTSDIEKIVGSFYDGIEQDPILGSFFSGLNPDIHLPKMVAFWSSVTFHTAEYNGRPFDPHARLESLDRTHFAAWLSRFNATVDDHFQGDTAELMKQKAEQIATIFQVKLGLWEVLDQQ